MLDDGAVRVTAQATIDRKEFGVDGKHDGDDPRQGDDFRRRRFRRG